MIKSQSLNDASSALTSVTYKKVTAHDAVW